MKEQELVDFQAQIRPLLADRCFQCHGPDGSAREGNLRLDRFEGATADLGGYKAVVPFDLEASELVYRTGDKVFEEERMPPLDSGLILKPEEAELLHRWIEQGAVYKKHWSFTPIPGEVLVPQPQNSDAWVRDPLDAFVLAGLQQKGLSPNREAERTTWLRRVSFALTGLPPRPDTILTFLADESDDAHERQVDNLLASPHLGERFARIWLDLARYADTYGYQADMARRVWPYRDWVINAYNSNQPFDAFLQEQLAGDLLPEATRAQRLATAFQRLHRQTNEGGSVEEEFRAEYVADRVQTVGTAFLGLTFECARCHDHRFDPILQEDFYGLSAFFDNIDESGLYSHFTNATPTPALLLPDAVQERAMELADQALDTAETRWASAVKQARGA
ncbi:MAG: DUF1549 domain-containing protein, partial [Dehalococcoidales bacterium]